MEILPARVAQDVAEGVDPTPPLGREVDVVSGVIHLRLLARRGLEPLHRRDDGPRTQRVHSLAKQRVASLITEPLQLFVDSLRRDVGIAGQQIGDRVLMGVELTAPSWPGLGQLRRRIRTAGSLDSIEHSLDGTTADVQALGDPPDRRTAPKADHDLVHQGVVHRFCISTARSAAPSATQRASRASRSKMGPRTRRSAAVRDVQP